MAKSKNIYSRRFAPLTERLEFHRIVTPSGCWEWDARRDTCGYGMITVCGEVLRSHRVSYEVYVGNIPEGVLVLHRCDNPPCFRPDHLFLGTDADNTRDMIQKGRMPIGEKRPAAKLTTEQVISIRNDPRSNKEMAQLYGLDPSSISKLRARKKWAHLP